MRIAYNNIEVILRCLPTHCCTCSIVPHFYAWGNNGKTGYHLSHAHNLLKMEIPLLIHYGAVNLPGNSPTFGTTFGYII
jgi:hypothetical protein